MYRIQDSWRETVENPFQRVGNRSGVPRGLRGSFKTHKISSFNTGQSASNPGRLEPSVLFQDKCQPRCWIKTAQNNSDKLTTF
jgi:hypothetical protein